VFENIRPEACLKVLLDSALIPNLSKRNTLSGVLHLPFSLKLRDIRSLDYFFSRLYRLVSLPLEKPLKDLDFRLRPEL
jgi:hypothetical protein